ncbi:MAG: MBL fold metallo-hydrolase [Xanthomonadales bacterium]|nr:MBL fold metallo-hydrolase [Xanthomonadales bacterium]
MLISHHGAVTGTTGSCHRLQIDDHNAVLIDCGLFQGDEKGESDELKRQQIDFPIDDVRALILTHVHIDHVGRLPYLLAAGYTGPIYCSTPSATLLPLVIEDALKVGFTRNERLIKAALNVMQRQLRPVEYKTWQSIELPPAPHSGSAGVPPAALGRPENRQAQSAPLPPRGSELARDADPSATTTHRPSDTATEIDQTATPPPVRFRLQPAGHILGSAYVEIDVGTGRSAQRAVFSGDLGAPHAPLLPAPRPPQRADIVVLESTYGDRVHENRKTRVARLQAAIEHALADGGTVMVPAFSIGRTQELLYELEGLIHQHPHWQDIEIIVDSPLAAKFTAAYRQLRPWWDAEAHARVRAGRHPLSFANLYTVDSHEEHLKTVTYLAKTRRPAVVLAASGMAAGGRIVNYLKAMIEDPRHDVLFVGYQAHGTPGRAIQQYGPKGGYVDLDGQRYTIRARVHAITGYSAHAGQDDLVNFIARMRKLPREVRLVHGDEEAKHTLHDKLLATANARQQFLRVSVGQAWA